MGTGHQQEQLNHVQQMRLNAALIAFITGSGSFRSQVRSEKYIDVDDASAKDPSTE